MAKYVAVVNSSTRLCCFYCTNMHHLATLLPGDNFASTKSFLGILLCLSPCACEPALAQEWICRGIGCAPVSLASWCQTGCLSTGQPYMPDDGKESVLHTLAHPDTVRLLALFLILFRIVRVLFVKLKKKRKKTIK